MTFENGNEYLGSRNGRNFITSWATVSLSSRTLLQVKVNLSLFNKLITVSWRCTENWTYNSIFIIYCGKWSFSLRRLCFRGTSPLYPLSKRFYGPQIRSGLRKEKTFSLPGINLQPSLPWSLYRLSYCSPYSASDCYSSNFVKRLNEDIAP
jgi:hypothetical protein